MVEIKGGEMQGMKGVMKGEAKKEWNMLGGKRRQGTEHTLLVGDETQIVDNNVSMCLWKSVCVSERAEEKRHAQF